jgi:hypothetical protein
VPSLPADVSGTYTTCTYPSLTSWLMIALVSLGGSKHI